MSRVNASAPPQPVAWLPLRLPASARSRAHELGEVLRAARVPAVVSHRNIHGGETVALIPVDENDAVVAIQDGFEPVVRWSVVERGALLAEIARAIGVEASLDDDPEGIDDPHFEPGDLDGDPGGVEEKPGEASGGIISVAWTTTLDDAVLAVVSHRVSAEFATVGAGMPRVVVPLMSPTDAVDRAAWATTDGLAVWRTEDEYAAAIVTKSGPHIAFWVPRPVIVDPSRPGQQIEGHGPLRDVLAVLAADPEPDDEKWIARFALDADRAAQLRALFRREPEVDTLTQLIGLLEMPGELADIVVRGSDPTEMPGYTRVMPEGVGTFFRRALRDEMSASAEADAVRPMRWRHHHPRLWAAISIFVIVTLALVGVVGLMSGRPTALLPLAAACVWLVAMAIERRTGRRSPDRPK